MYNRYIPQSDGSYQRNHVTEAQRQTQNSKPSSPPQPQKPPKVPDPSCTPTHKPEPVGGFLRQLLPRNFDTADMIIVLLLLLLAGDNEEDKSTAMLTLALYLFM